MENENEIPQTEIEQTDWLTQEAEQFAPTTTYDKTPNLKIEPNKVYELEIDFNKPFYKFASKYKNSKGDVITKVVIPVTYGGQKLTWFLNSANPLYRQVIESGIKKQNVIKIVATGIGMDIKYNMVA